MMDVTKEIDKKRNRTMKSLFSVFVCLKHIFACPKSFTSPLEETVTCTLTFPAVHPGAG